MTDQNTEGRALSEEELQDLVSSSDAGARNPVGPVGTFLAITAIVWSLFQVILASPISNQLLPGSVINNSRQIHLAFAIFLAFMAYPALKSSPRHYVPVQDWIMAIGGAFISMYGYIVYDKIVKSGGLADDTDKWVALIGLILLFEAARRALGPAMAIIATIFLLYVFYGSSPIVPRRNPMERRFAEKGHEPYVDDIRRCLWYRAWGFDQVCFPLCPLWCSAR